MEKCRIAFYTKLKNIKNNIVSADFEQGNPGIGGTQYIYLLTVKYLNKMYGEGYSVILTDDEITLSDVEIKCHYTDNPIDYCEKKGIIMLVFNAYDKLSINFSKLKTDVKIILWAHNTLNNRLQKIAARSESVYRVVCVSESQYNNMIDTECFPKCTYINNIISQTFYENAKTTNYNKKAAVYVGSIVPNKGIHNLIDIWKYVEEKDIHLYVIGGANMYNPDIELGELGIADVYYEKLIKRKLHKIEYKENIHFLGAMGWDCIKEVISECRVGIVNPSYYLRDETFCISAVELQAHGLPVVSRKRNDGLETTINNGKSGYLKKNNKEIAKGISYILNNPEEASKMGEFAINKAKTFIGFTEVKKWNYLVENIQTVQCKKKYISKDSILVLYDRCRLVLHTIYVGKFFKAIKKRIFNR